MDIGLHALGIGTGANRDVIDSVAATAEAAGFATLWAGEHVIAVDSPASRYPYSSTGRIAVPPEAAWNDPMITLSFAAAATSTIKIATGVLLLPEHNALVVAKQAATLDQLSGGRLVLGVGLGWSREEFAALGVPFERRGERTEQYVAAMRTLWRDDPASFDSDFVRFDSVRMHPKPSRRSQHPHHSGRQQRLGVTSHRRVGRRLVRLQPRLGGRGRRTAGASFDQRAAQRGATSAKCIARSRSAIPTRPTSVRLPTWASISS